MGRTRSMPRIPAVVTFLFGALLIAGNAMIVTTQAKEADGDRARTSKHSGRGDGTRGGRRQPRILKKGRLAGKRTRFIDRGGDRDNFRGKGAMSVNGGAGRGKRTRFIDRGGDRKNFRAGGAMSKNGGAGRGTIQGSRGGGKKDNNNNRFPLRTCQANCHSDSDCGVNLKCFKRNGNESIPGCSGANVNFALNYCYHPATPSASQPRDNGVLEQIYKNGGSQRSFLLGRCQGDCDNDAECQMGLICVHRTQFEPVSRCIKTFGFDKGDFCSDPL